MTKVSIRDDVPAWLACPNDPACPHTGLLHDIYKPDDPRPMCCVDGCRCGRPPAGRAWGRGATNGEGHP